MSHVSFITESRSFHTGALRAVLPAYNRQGEWKLSNISELRFELPLYHKSVKPENLECIRDEIWLWRVEDEVPRLIFAGPLMTMYVNNSEQRLTCTANSLEAHLAMRVIEPYYIPDGIPPGVKYIGDPEDIAWELIRQAQARKYGDMRIVRGERGRGGPDVEYLYQTSDYKGVLDSIMDDLVTPQAGVELGGAAIAFDFWIDPATRTWNTYFPHKGSNLMNSVALQYGGNVKSYWNQIYGSTMGTWVAVQGAGDPPDIETYESVISSEKYGLRQKVVAWKDSPARDRLQQVARHNVALLGAPKQVIGMTLRGEDFNLWADPVEASFNGARLGDIVRLRIDDGFTQINKGVRIVGFQLTIGSEDNETYNLYTNDLREVLGDANATG